MCFSNPLSSCLKIFYIILLGSIQIFWKDNIGDQHFREQQEGIILIRGDFISRWKTNVTLWCNRDSLQVPAGSHLPADHLLCLGCLLPCCEFSALVHLPHMFRVARHCRLLPVPRHLQPGLHRQLFQSVLAVLPPHLCSLALCLPPALWPGRSLRASGEPG